MICRIRRVHRLVSALPVLGLVVLAACDGGGGGSGGTGATGVLSVTLSPDTAFLKVGQTQAFTAQATMTSGSRQDVTSTASWNTDAPAVATVDSGGVVRAVSPGEATVWAEYHGIRGTRRLRVAPDYQATWYGTYRSHGCTESGIFAVEHMCAAIEEVFVGSQEMLLQLVHDSAGVRGEIMLGMITGSVTGSTDAAGTLSLQGTVRVEGEGGVILFALADWNTMAHDDRMTGSFTLVWTVEGAVGEMRVACALEAVTKVAPASARMRPEGGVRIPTGATLSERIRALLSGHR